MASKKVSKKTTKKIGKKGVEKKSRKPRVPKYVTEDGDYVLVVETNNGIQLTWVNGDDYDEFGLCVGESDFLPEGEPTGRSDREIWLANKAAKPFACEEVSNSIRGFVFDNMSKAAMALNAVNEALNAGKSMPEWAVKAKSAGWKPPAGWKP